MSSATSRTFARLRRPLVHEQLRGLRTGRTAMFHGAVVLVAAAWVVGSSALPQPQGWLFVVAVLLALRSRITLESNIDLVLTDAFFIPPLVLFIGRGSLVIVGVGILLFALLQSATSWYRSLALASTLAAIYGTVNVAVALLIPLVGHGSVALVLVTVCAFLTVPLAEVVPGWLGYGLLAGDWKFPFAGFESLLFQLVHLGFELPIACGAILLYRHDPWFACMMYIPLAVASWVARRKRHLDQRVDFLHESFSRYVPAAMVDAMIESGQEIELGGAEVEVSVLFCDIRGFTAWSETLQPQQVIGELNELLGDLAAAVFATGGTLDKFTGDGLMAFWGAPLAQADHAERASICAARMVSSLFARNQSRVADGLPELAIGIGIHSGPAVIGNVGHAERHDYTAIGDTVNTAARLEAATKEVGATAVVSAATHALLPELLQRRCARHGGVAVKGKREPVETYVLIPRGETGIHLHLPSEELAS